MAAPVYTYTSNTPQGAAQFNLTQSPILNNFRAINELVNVNHIGFNIPDTYGKHSFLSMPFQTEYPETGSQEGALFVQETPDGPNDAEIFFRYPNNGTVIQISNTLNENNTVEGTGYISTPYGDQGAVVLSSGYMIKWGRIETTGAPAGYVTFPTTGLTSPGGSQVTIPTFKYAPNVSLQSLWRGSSAQAGSGYYSTEVTQTSFRYTFSGAAGDGISYIALGF